MKRGFAMTRDGVRIAYQSSGQGPAFVCCHPMAMDQRMWDEFRERFSAHHQFITFDQRGSGASDHPPFEEGPDCAYSTERFGDDLRAVLDALAIKQARILGYSMGNVAALSLATRWPERVERLVLASAMASRFPEAIVSRARMIEEVLDTQGIKATYDFYFSGPLFEDLRNDANFTEHVQRVLASATPHGFKGCFRVTIDRPSMVDALPRIQAPTLVLVGDRDTHYLAEADMLAATIPNARKIVIKDAGHPVATQQMQAFQDAVLDFMA